MSLARCSSKVSEMYLRKMRPRTTCLYSAASMLLRSLSAVSQSVASKPMVAEDWAEEAEDLARAMKGVRCAGERSLTGRARTHKEKCQRSCEGLGQVRRVRMGRQEGEKTQKQCGQNRRSKRNSRQW